ncbi:fibronectin type III domain-containing protein [Streptomyces cellulosae]
MAITKFIPQMWAAALLERFAAAEVLAGTVNRQYEGDARRGNTVKITSITTPKVVDYKAAGRKVTPEQLVDTQQDLLIDQERSFAFNVDDIDRVQAAGSFEPVTRDAGNALVEDSEAFLAKGLLGGTALPAVDVKDGNVAFDVVRDIMKALGQKKVPKGDRFLAVNPAFSAMLLGADSKLTSVDTSGTPAGLRNAIIGQLLNFTVVETPMFEEATLPVAVGYHRSALAYVNQLDKVEGYRAHDTFADTVRALHVYGTQLIRPDAAVSFTGKAPAKQLAAPKNIKAKGTPTKSAIEVQWDAVDGAASYTATAKKADDTGHEIPGTSTGTTSAKFTGLEADTDYKASVIAKGDGTKSADGPASTSTAIHTAAS